MMRALAFGLLFPLCAAWGAERQVALLTDPVGDDDGDGALVYPQRSDFERGDLDLVSLRIVRDGAGYRFEATFRNPVRDPARIAGDVGAESLAAFARRGFYSFNLDLYIDLDRVAGSGNVFTLPGRRARIDESSAWERAVVLTPRPELMRDQLIDAVAEGEPGTDRAEIAARIDRTVLFATDVRVRGRSVAFTAPAAFLAGGRPDSDWAVTALVTGAKTSIEADLNLFGSARPALERLVLGAMQPAQGRPRDSFGYSGTRAPSPVVDLLAATAADQRRLLAAGGALAGLNWNPALSVAVVPGARPAASLLRSDAGVAARPSAEAGSRGAPAPAVPPAAAPAAVPPAAPAALPPAAAQAAPPIAPAAPPATLAAPTAPREATGRASIAERLQALKQLYDQKLIDESEYRQQRQRILNEL